MIEAALPVDHFDSSAEEVEARIGDARRRGAPYWLWPEVSSLAWRQALSAIEEATRSILGRAGPARLPEIDPYVLSLAGYTSGAGPLLGYWAAQGLLSAPYPVAAVLELQRRHNESRMATLATSLDALLVPMREEGIEPVVLKGMHTAFTYFPDPASRPVSDIDLLTGPEDFDVAARLLRLGGYRERTRQHRPRRSDWAPVGGADRPRSLWLTHADDPYTIDLHESLDRDFFGVRRIHFDAVFDARRTRSISADDATAGGRRGLPQPLLTLLLATHASEGLHSLSLIRIVELCLVVRSDTKRGLLDWDELLVMAENRGALRFAYPALALSDRLAPGLVPPPVLRRFRNAATRTMREVVDRLTPATAQRIDRPLSIRERLMWAGSPGEIALRVGHGLWPAPAGRSLRRLTAIYRDRAWRVIRGAVER